MSFSLRQHVAGRDGVEGQRNWQQSKLSSCATSLGASVPFGAKGRTGARVLVCGGAMPSSCGTDGKTMWSFLLMDNDQAPVKASNQFFLCMHELRKLCEACNVPFYIENTLRSKFRRLPHIRAWMRNEKARMTLDYYQLWMGHCKPIQILVVGTFEFSK